jgi:hypothetical protein
MFKPRGIYAYIFALLPAKIFSVITGIRQKNEELSPKISNLFYK